MSVENTKELIVISNTSDNSFAIDIARFCSQPIDISDIVALKDFQNSEFCPRFIIESEEDINKIGHSLEGKTVAIVSTSGMLPRNALAMRNMIIARAAKDNSAKEVILIEPDLFYSCQDRGPRNEHSFFEGKRSIADKKKFDGQPFTASLYAELLKYSGVDRVITVHNHSESTQKIFNKEFSNFMHNQIPTDLYANYLCSSKIVDCNKIVLCSPDEGASDLVVQMKKEIKNLGFDTSLLHMSKNRLGERSVEVQENEDSEISIEDIKDRDVVVFDDMVRTGTTIVKCCEFIKKYNPRRIIFCVTHFHPSPESRENLNSSYIDEIITTNTIPTILNRDSQGRLRKKLVVLKIEEWLAKKLYEYLGFEASKFDEKLLYFADISSKNPRSSLFRAE